MKQLIFISASMMLVSASFAQVRDDAFFSFGENGTPKEISKLGAAPEFPFIKNKTSADAVYAAIKKHENDKTETMRHMNSLLMQIGYTNGAKDLEPGDITEEMLAPGTVGNMGSRGYTHRLYRMEMSGDNLKAWKVAPKGNNSSALYFLASCGNAFTPKKDARAACVNVPVEVKPDMTEITLPASGSKVSSINKTFVYYTRKHHKKGDKAYPVAGINDKYPSDPLLVNEKELKSIRPETYSVSIGNSRNVVTACVNQTLDPTANINVEKTSTYTGNYPLNGPTYLKVSRHHYMMIARKMRNSKRKADKIAKRTSQHVEVNKA